MEDGHLDDKMKLLIAVITISTGSYFRKYAIALDRACLAITGAIQGTSRTKLYDELGVHSLIK